MQVIKTIGSVFYNGYRPWFETDDPFVEQFQIKEPCIIQQYTKENKFLAEYQLDQNGFRNQHSLDAKLWFFGGSDIFGEALPLQQIYPQLIANALGCEYYNFGTPAAGVELVARLLFKLRNKLADKKIIVVLPSFLRYETCVNGQYKCLVPKNTDYLDFLPESGMEDHIAHKMLYATMLIQSLTEKLDCRFFHFHPNENAMEDKFRNKLGSLDIPNSLHLDRAADNKHYGPLTNQATAEYILKSLAR